MQPGPNVSDRPPPQSIDPVADVAAGLGAGPDVVRGALVGVALAADGRLGLATAPGLAWWTAADPLVVLPALARDLGVRLTWWSAGSVRPLVAAGLRVTASWDVAATHRLVHGGHDGDPAVVWAVASGRAPESRPRSGQLDLLGGGDHSDAGDDPVQPWAPVRPDGYLRPGWAEVGPPDGPAAAGWAACALQVAGTHRATLADGAAALLTAWSESAAELLAVELELTGLPLDRDTATALIAERVGPRPVDAEQARAERARRDAAVLDLLPGAEDTDLRNPAQVRDLLTRIGIDVPDTRSWRLEPLRETHPLVAALLAWRKAERIATTYGYGWLDRHVGPDGRLRGTWTGCDGAAGRMTASAGLHNLPAELRPAVAAEPGHVLVRADLGQVEPRVLAAVSGDQAFAAAAADPDLYAPVAARLGVERPVAKVAVLAAMYGQTSGAAGEALRGLERAYPVAMSYLRAADERGKRGEHVRTYGGRLVRMWPLADPPPPPAVAARGRFARNAVVQGAAAELFKMWAVAVRAALPDGARIVLCLHDELLVHAAEADAPEVERVLHEVLDRTAARWAPGSGVRFVADVVTVRRWSDAKG
ncbi:MAG TPA: DNA polymerase [Actinomycetes bacterium]|nr:DNA polymerase [Actinomycetes bacterium]